MTNKVSKSKSAVRAAREAVKASQKEVLERAARNAEDLAVFFSSRERLDAVDEWLETKIAILKEQADGKRAEHRRMAGAALVALRDRGELVRDIARLAGIGEKAVRDLMRYAEGNDAQAKAGGRTHSLAVRQAAARAAVTASEKTGRPVHPDVAELAGSNNEMLGAPADPQPATG
ncbi:hypothetical protein [Mycolicibacterium neoaurum]|uniref:hypothetical protein n=1 Tax=Mycolicibacterium neoaurum TaxID=1795 RepID=UPI001F4D08AE|nr:hypothetical protein [Mycolicibacterium neoaurum]